MTPPPNKNQIVEFSIFNIYSRTWYYLSHITVFGKSLFYWFFFLIRCAENNNFLHISMVNVPVFYMAPKNKKMVDFRSFHKYTKMGEYYILLKNKKFCYCSFYAKKMVFRTLFGKKNCCSHISIKLNNRYLWKKKYRYNYLGL